MSNTVTNQGTPISGRLSDNLITEKQKDLFKTIVDPDATPLVLDALYYRERVEDVDVNVKSLVNRDTEVKNIVRVIKEAGGFDIKCWNRPKVARLPDGTQHIFDGDHSRAIYKEFFPSEATIPCDIIDVGNVAEIHKLFIRYNAKCKTSIKAEEVFVHEFHSGDEKAIELAYKLLSSGLQVYCSHEDGGAVGDADGMRVKVGAAKKAFAIQEEVLVRHPKLGYSGAVAEAVEIIKSAGLSSSMENIVPAELLGGLTLVLSLNPELRGTNPDAIIFRNWIDSKLSNDSVKVVAKIFKTEGGGIVNWAEYSVAMGIMSGLMQDPLPRVLTNLQGCYNTRLMTRSYGPKKSLRRNGKRR
jgi:hypothetical protein